jgi:hypothetical protein
MPRTQTIVYLTETAYRNYQSWELSKLLTIHMLQFRRQVHDYLGGETRPAAVMGSNIHGHFFWTSLTGLQYAFESGLFPHLAELVQLSRIYIDPQRVFPELADRPAPFFNDMPESFRHCVERKLLPIHFTDYQMNDAFGERIRRVAAANATEAGSPPPDAPRPLIWINLRGHTKIWINQAEGYSSILNAIYEEYGAVSVLLDGMRDCADLAEQIRARTRPEIPLYDGLKLNVYDTLNWAFAVDAYICPIGSALTITSAMANKPGVAHAETHHMQQMPWWHTVRTGLTMPLVPEMSQITDIGSDLYCNYDVDWRVLLELLRRVLRENYGEPPRQELRA